MPGQSCPDWRSQRRSIGLATQEGGDVETIDAFLGQLIDPGAIKDIGLLAIEGERDDISGIGQTKAALKISKNLPADHKKYLLAKEVGHYGIFNGSRWRVSIAPVVDAWILRHEGKGKGRKLTAVA